MTHASTGSAIGLGDALIVGNHKGSEFVGLVKRVCELRKFDA